MDERRGVRLLIVDDEAILSSALMTSLKTHGFSEIESAQSAMVALQKFKSFNPDLCLIDIDLKDGPTGVDIAHVMRKLNPDVGIAFLTSLVDPKLMDSSIPELPEDSLYLKKSLVGDIETLAKILHELVEGSATKVLQEKHHPNYLDMTASQYEVMRLVAAGNSNSEISRIRFTTVKSVENSISRLSKKLGLDADSTASQRVLITRKYLEFIGKL